MDKSSMQEAFQKAGLSGLLKDAQMLARPSIRLVLTPEEEDKIAVGASKLGGVPDVPEGWNWPEWKGMPQMFIGQIKLEDVREHDVEHVLPSDGMLWFFYDATQETYGESPDDKGGWQVFYRGKDKDSQDLTKLQRAQFPEKLPQQSRLHPCSVSFVNDLTLSQQPELEISDLSWKDEQVEQYEDMVLDLPKSDKLGVTRDRLLGFADTLQDDMRLQCQLMTNGITDYADPRVEELKKGIQDWCLLLQVDSDDKLGARWGSTGMIYYWIKRSDLQARNFDNTWLILQSE